MPARAARTLGIDVGTTAVNVVALAADGHPVAAVRSAAAAVALDDRAAVGVSGMGPAPVCLDAAGRAGPATDGPAGRTMRGGP